MNNDKIEKIMELDRKIESVVMKTTSCFCFGEKQNLNKYDRQVLEYYQEILNLIIEITKEEGIKNVELIDNKYFNVENTASMMIEGYMSVLQFYGNIDREIMKKEIQVINQIQENLELDNDFEIKNKIEIANCYFHIGDENKARNLILDFINYNPDEDEAYMCMQNWYMYDKPDINKLAEVIDFAERNKHILITDFGYDKLVKFYDSIGDIENKKKYQELYDKWKNNRTTIEF
ncbi:MAG: hypothetical protein J6A89_01130 [Clostridia bacterium]|nr:hypothetical protein [Clostridia bacterium]